MANIEGSYPEIERVETGLRTLDLALSGSGGVAGWPMTIYEVFGFQGVGKCLGKGTKVLMYDGTLRKVEDIRRGDKLMGVDSTPRLVLSLGCGVEEMFLIKQKRGVDYRVNKSHILSLKFSGRQNGWGTHGEVRNISVGEVIETAPASFLTRWLGYKVPVEFPHREVPVDPYFLGLWLGDGTSESIGITNVDQPIIDFIYLYASKIGLGVHVQEQEGKVPSYHITTKNGDKRNIENTLQNKLRKLGVLNNKHIPQEYLSNSREVRIALLSGLIDSDGYYNNKNNTYSITQKRYGLISEIKFLCDSLGLGTGSGIKETWKKSQNSEKELYYTLNINGDMSEFPILLRRKQQEFYSSNEVKDKLVTNISIIPDGMGEYYGFTLSGDGLFLLEDMTVTHNTTFSTSMAGIVAEHYKKNIVYAPIEHVDRVLMNDQLDSVGFKSGMVSILGGWDMAKKFLDLKKGKDDIITDEVILDCMREAMRRDEYCVGILDSLTAISPFEEGEGSTADKNMGRRARLVGALVRGILYDSRFRTSPYSTILLSHKTNPMSLTPTNTGAPTTGGETKKNIAKVRISLRRIVEKSMNDLGENAYILEGKVDKNNFGADKGVFVVGIVGGKGIHRGLTAMYECKRAKICTFGKSITLGGQSYGSMRDIVAKSHDRNEDKFFQPFIDAIRTPSKFEKVKETEEDDSNDIQPWDELPD